MGCFIGDPKYQIVLSQYLQLGDNERSEFKRMLDQAVKHDAVVRLTGRYDADSAFAAVTANYALRREHGG